MMLPETAATPGSDYLASKNKVRKYTWAYIKRVICENYPGMKPNDIPSMTMDDILTLTLERKELLNNAVTSMTAGEARSAGLIPENPFGGKSLVKQVQANLAEKEAIEQLRAELEELETVERAKQGPDSEWKPSRKYRRLKKQIRKRASELEKVWIDSI